MKPFRRNHNRLLVIEDDTFYWGRRRRSGWQIALWISVLLVATLTMMYFSVN